MKSNEQTAATLVSSPAQVELEQYAAAIETAFLIRATEQKLLDLFSEGKLHGTVHTCLGQEFVGVAVARALRQGDFLCSNHRGHGHYLAWTNDLDGLIGELLGRITGVCGGRGGSQHLCLNGFYSNGIQGGMMPVAAGMALAEKIKQTGAIGCVFIGDGTLGEGAVYEALNIIAKLKLPLMVLIENNGYSQSTAQAETLSGTFDGRAKAFGIPYYRGSTWKWVELFGTVERAASEVRSGGGPVICVVDTYRLAPHSKGDDNRDPNEIKHYQELDPLNELKSTASDWILEIATKVQDRVNQTTKKAEAAEIPSALGIRQPVVTDLVWEPISPDGDGLRVVDRIRGSIEQAMAGNENILFFGEDVMSPYGGAFKVSNGLSDRFQGRVLNLPISELAIAGLGNGLALRGMRPFAEIMFGDFVTLCFDQILNHAAKFGYMYNDKVSVPLVLRTPMGGRRGYGPTHSQSLEKHILGIPDTQVLAINRRTPIERVYTALSAVDRCTIVCEYKVLYGRKTESKAPQGYVAEATRDDFPAIRLRPINQRPMITIVTYGEMLDVVEEAVERLFDDHEIISEVIAPTRLYPLDLRPVLESVRLSERLLVVEEGQMFAGFGGELIAGLHDLMGDRPWRSRRVAAAPVPIPATKQLEELALPSATSIVEAALEVVTK